MRAVDVQAESSSVWPRVANGAHGVTRPTAQRPLNLCNQDYNRRLAFGGVRFCSGYGLDYQRIGASV